jgi:hypothetical protein
MVRLRKQAPKHIEKRFEKTDLLKAFRKVAPNDAKVGGLQRQGAEGAAVVNLVQALGNDGSGALRLCRRVKKVA